MPNGEPSRRSIITKLIACVLLGAIGLVFLSMAAVPILDPGGGAGGQEARAKMTATKRVIGVVIPGTISLFFFATMVSVARARR